MGARACNATKDRNHPTWECQDVLDRPLRLVSGKKSFPAHSTVASKRDFKDLPTCWCIWYKYHLASAQPAVHPPAELLQHGGRLQPNSLSGEVGRACSHAPSADQASHGAGLEGQDPECLRGNQQLPCRGGWVHGAAAAPAANSQGTVAL